jgi:hypothetical protein
MENSQPSGLPGIDLLSTMRNDERWTNNKNVLPNQMVSFVSQAAHQLGYNETTVPRPFGLEKLQTFKLKYRVAQQPQMLLIQDAYSACHRLTVLHRESDLDRLRRAETMELEAAARKLPVPDDTLRPRSTSVAVLVNPALIPNMMALLDAVAFLARAPSTDLPPRIAVQDTRIVFLAGIQARHYANWRLSDAVTTNSASAKGGSEVCVTWAASQSADSWQLRSEFAPLPYCETAEQYLDALLATIRSIWVANDMLPDATRLLQSYTRQVDGAYLDGMVACADDFWSLLRVTTTPQLSRYASTNPDFCGRLEYSKQFVKMIPKATKREEELPPDHPSIYHGLLLHQQGKESESKEFCEAIKSEELGKGFAVFSLRPPATSSEEAVCPHLFFMTADQTTLGAKVTTYGLLASPGKRLCTVHGNLVWRLTCKIVPLDEKILSHAFVLPCTQGMCDPQHGALRLPMWSALSAAAEEHSELFGWDPPLDSPVGQRRVRATLAQTLVSPRPPNDTERSVGVLLGTPLSCTAFRIGDVYNVVREEGCADSVAKFLLAATSVLGSDESIEQAFLHGAEAIASARKTQTDHEKELTTLKRKLEERDLTIETLERAQRHRAEVAPLPSMAAPSFPTVSYDQVTKLLLGIGIRESKLGFPLNTTWKKVDVKTVCTVLLNTCSLPKETLNETTVPWAKERLKSLNGNGTDLQLIGEIVGHGLTKTGCTGGILLWYDNDSNVVVYAVALDGGVQTISALDLLSLDLPKTPMLVWNATKRLLANTESCS